MDKTHFIGFFLRILRILLHLKQLSHQTKQHKGSENLPFSRNLVKANRKRRGQGGVMWRKDNKRSEANHIAWIYLIQSNTTHCAKLGLMRVQKSYIVASSAQVIYLTCKRGSVGQSEGLSIPRSSVRFRLKPDTPNSNFIDPQTRVLNYF